MSVDYIYIIDLSFEFVNFGKESIESKIEPNMLGTINVDIIINIIRFIIL